MVSTFHGLELGKRGLAVGQASIATTGHNIANANTKGYSRQQVNTSTSPSLDIWSNGTVNPSQLGSGVSLDSITRVRDSFLDQRYREQAGTLGEWTVRQQTLDHLETVINEPSNTGLNSSMDRLLSAWQDLSNEPDSASAQAVLKERAQEFVETAQAMDRSMESLTADLNQQMAAKTGEANSYLQQIAELNDSIMRRGSQANDLLDQRDVLVEKLSSLMSIKVEPQANGIYNIRSTADGASLVAGSTHNALTADSVTSGGELSGISKSLETVAAYRGQLTESVKNFAAANGMGAAGDGNVFGGQEAGFTIASLSVNRNADVTAAPAGMEVAAQTAKQSFHSLVSQLGAESQTAIRSVANHTASLQATDNRRQSVSGVSLDEEMANLIKYQHSYNAAARLVSMTDQMLDTIINRMAAR